MLTVEDKVKIKISETSSKLSQFMNRHIDDPPTDALYDEPMAENAPHTRIGQVYKPIEQSFTNHQQQN